MRNPPPSPGIPGPGVGKRGQAGHLGYLLRQANVAFRARLERALADTGVTHPQFTVMTMVAAYPGCSGADLARLSLLTAQTVTVIVANLKRDGILEAAPHPVHGRIRQLSLTARGEEVLRTCKSVVRRLERDLAAGLSPREEAIVRRWLVAAALGENAPERMAHD